MFVHVQFSTIITLLNIHVLIWRIYVRCFVLFIVK